MNRRNFLGMMIGGVATAAAVRTFPFRVFSFPKEIKRAQFVDPLTGKLILISTPGGHEPTWVKDQWLRPQPKIDPRVWEYAEKLRDMTRVLIEMNS
jgi:hypothetical protein